MNKSIILTFLLVMPVCCIVGADLPEMAQREGFPKETRNIAAGPRTSSDVCCVGCVVCCCVPIVCVCLVHEKYIAPVKASIANVLDLLCLTENQHQE